MRLRKSKNQGMLVGTLRGFIKLLQRDLGTRLTLTEILSCLAQQVDQGLGPSQGGTNNLSGSSAPKCGLSAVRSVRRRLPHVHIAGHDRTG